MDSIRGKVMLAWFLWCSVLLAHCTITYIQICRGKGKWYYGDTFNTICMARLFRCKPTDKQADPMSFVRPTDACCTRAKNNICPFEGCQSVWSNMWAIRRLNMWVSSVQIACYQKRARPRWITGGGHVAMWSVRLFFYVWPCHAVTMCVCVVSSVQIILRGSKSFGRHDIGIIYVNMLIKSVNSSEFSATQSTWTLHSMKLNFGQLMWDLI